jgi:hypothetical protein
MPMSMRDAFRAGCCLAQFVAEIGFQYLPHRASRTGGCLNA